MALYCTRCNTANREGSRFCNNCGAPFDISAPMQCPNCQTPIITYSLYCHHCGARLPEPEVPPVTAPPPITETDQEGGDESGESEVISLDQVPPLSAAADESSAATAPPATRGEEPTTADASQSAQTGASERIARPGKPIEQHIAPVLVRVRPPVATTPQAIGVAPAHKDRSGVWRRLAYLILATAIVTGLLLPVGSLGTATTTSPEVLNLFQAIEAIPPRSTVLVSFDYDMATADELRPLAQAVIAHLMQRQARLLVMSLLPQGPALAQAVIQPLAEENIYAYGADYVNIGYLPGDEAALAAAGADLPKAFGNDFIQTEPLAGFAALRGVTSVTDLALIITIAGDEASLRRWVEQVQGRYGIRLAAATSALAMPLTFPYLQSGQVVGLASSLPGAAQYESLLAHPGQATRVLDALTLGQLAILFFIVIANVGLIGRRLQTRKA